MRHRDLAEYIADRLGRWRTTEHRRQYVEGLVKTLDARRCSCAGHCDTERSRANLTQVGDALVCPEILYDVAQYDITHQTLAAETPAAPAHGLTVADLPRAMAGRLAMLEGRRSA